MENGVPVRQQKSIFNRAVHLQTAEARELISYFCLILIVSLDFMGLTIQNPLLPFYVREFDDAKDLEVGFATSLLSFSYALSQFIATPLFGIASDRVGRRPMLLLSLLGGGLGFLAQGFAKSLVSLCLLRFFTGCFGGSRPVAIAYISDTVPPERQPKYISGIALSVSVSMFLAPVLGGSMGLVDLALPCFFQAGAALLGLGVSFIYLREPKKNLSGDAGKAALASQNIPRRPWKRWLVANAIVGAMMMFNMACWSTLFPIIGQNALNLDANKIGLILGGGALMIAVSQFLIFVPMSKKTSICVIGSVGIVIFAAPCAWPLLDDKVWFAIVVSGLQGFGAALVFPGVTMIVSMLCPPQRRGASISLTISAQAFMRVVAPLVAGPAYDAATWLPFMIMLATLVIAVFLELLLIMRVPLLFSRKKDDPIKVDQTEEETRQEILHNLDKVHKALGSSLETWQGKRRELQLGKTPEEIGVRPYGAEVPKITDAHKRELGEWMASMLESHGYRYWPEHFDTLKCMAQNAFPKLRDAKRLENRLADIEYLLESHLMLERQWQRFVLNRRSVIASSEYDVEALAELEFSVSCVDPVEEEEVVKDGSFVASKSSNPSVAEI